MRYFTEDHLWVEVDGSEARVGITTYAAEVLGDIDTASLPRVETDYIIEEEIGCIKTDTDEMRLYAPISGTICQINDVILEDLSLISSDPEDTGWLFTINNFDESELDGLLSEGDYLEYIDELEETENEDQILLQKVEELKKNSSKSGRRAGGKN